MPFSLLYNRCHQQESCFLRRTRSGNHCLCMINEIISVPVVFCWISLHIFRMIDSDDITVIDVLHGVCITTPQSRLNCLFSGFFKLQCREICLMADIPVIPPYNASDSVLFLSSPFLQYHT